MPDRAFLVAIRRKIVSSQRIFFPMDRHLLVPFDPNRTLAHTHGRTRNLSPRFRLLFPKRRHPLLRHLTQ
jgi:hypothetical protein